MAEAKKKTTAAKAAKTEPEVVPAVAEPKAETVEKKEEVKAETKPAAKKAPAKKTTVKKASEKKTVAKKATAVQQSLHIQYSDKNVSMDDLQKIAADVWKYDLNKGDEEFTSLDLYVKPEENTVYYVFNGDVQGNFLI